jgi:hypothetical protein
VKCVVGSSVAADDQTEIGGSVVAEEVVIGSSVAATDMNIRGSFAAVQVNIGGCVVADEVDDDDDGEDVDRRTNVANAVAAQDRVNSFNLNTIC